MGTEHTASQASESTYDRQFELVQSGYKLRLEISADGISCTARYESSPGGTGMSESDLRRYIAHCGVIEGIFETSIEMLLFAASESKPLSGVLLAKGVEAKPGIDGRLELMVANALANAEREPSDNSMCMKSVQEFFNIYAGDTIGKIHNPTNGVVGKTVYGTVIPALPGNPLDLELTETVMMHEDGVTVIAAVSGRVLYVDGVLSVEDTYTVEGDVDLRVGHIDFNGFVEITGDVLDGFMVKASKGIKIHGVAGRSVLESGGDIELAGMNGAGSGSIRCGGNLSLNFCNDATIYCAGTVVAQIEMRNCLLYCLGMLRIVKGTFGGGACTVLAGIEAGALGTKTSMPTTVISGVNYEDHAEIESFNRKLIEVNHQFASRSKENRDLAGFIGERNKLTAQLAEVRSRTYIQTNPRINVHRTVYENVKITIGQTFELTSSEMAGPVSLISNTINGGLRKLPMADMGIPAEDLEQMAILSETVTFETPVA